MKKIVIFGSGCHAKVVYSEILKLKKFKVLGFVDNYLAKKTKILKHKNKYVINIGSIDDLKKYKNVCGVIGVGSSSLRKKISKEIQSKIKNFKYAKIISKDAIINSNVKIGDGTVVISNSVINYGSVIGKHCLINTSCSIDHDNYFADFSGTGPGVVTGGKVSVGVESYLGIGSTIKNLVKIGKKTFIGGSSFVNKNCDDNTLYYGVPIKKVKKLKNKT